MRLRKWIVDVYHQQPHTALGTSPAAMWASSIRFEDIPLPDDTIDLKVLMGRIHQRKLTHKGIEFSGLFYNSGDLVDLRRRLGDTVEVEIRVDESDIGSIHVISPDSRVAYLAPCITPEYATGLSLWQHDVIRRRQSKLFPSESGALGYLKAKRELTTQVEQAISTGKRRSHKRLGRWKETTPAISEGPVLAPQPQDSPLKGKPFSIEPRSRDEEQDEDDLTGFTPVLRGKHLYD